VPISKEEAKARRLLAKNVAAELRGRAKAIGWKVSQGWLFREHNGWFVEARLSVLTSRPKSTVELHFKPMSIDPVFWEIMGLESNNSQPLSFRIFGAFTVGTHEQARIELDDTSLDAARLAELMLDESHRQFQSLASAQSVERFADHMRECQCRFPAASYLPAIVCALVLLDRRLEARELCQMALQRKETGGFWDGPRSKSFIDLALEWLAKTEPARH